jgi:hypothetical protein
MQISVAAETPVARSGPLIGRPAGRHASCEARHRHVSLGRRARCECKASLQPPILTVTVREGMTTANVLLFDCLSSTYQHPCPRPLSILFDPHSTESEATFLSHPKRRECTWRGNWHYLMLRWSFSSALGQSWTPAFGRLSGRADQASFRKPSPRR